MNDEPSKKVALLSHTVRCEVIHKRRFVSCVSGDQTSMKDKNRRGQRMLKPWPPLKMCEDIGQGSDSVSTPSLGFAQTKEMQAHQGHNMISVDNNRNSNTLAGFQTTV